jgi:Icc-related predicted phosphoesterase
MIIDCISDLHGEYPELEGGDLLIVAGDLTASDTQSQHKEFFEWLDSQEYDAKVYIAGNHDNYYQKNEAKKQVYPSGIVYLEDQRAEFEGLKIWGSPWTHSFPGMNPHCMAFTKPPGQLKDYWDLIPDNIDILITHGPPYRILDQNKYGQLCGCQDLRNKVLGLQRLKLHVFGHIHEGHGRTFTVHSSFVNASLMNGDYEFVNKPIRVIL